MTLDAGDDNDAIEQQQPQVEQQQRLTYAVLNSATEQTSLHNRSTKMISGGKNHDNLEWSYSSTDQTHRHHNLIDVPSAGDPSTDQGIVVYAGPSTDRNIDGTADATNNDIVFESNTCGSMDNGAEEDGEANHSSDNDQSNGDGHKDPLAQLISSTLGNIVMLNNTSE